MRSLSEWRLDVLRDLETKNIKEVEKRTLIHALDNAHRSYKLYEALRILHALNCCDLLPTQEEVTEWFKSGQVT